MKATLLTVGVILAIVGIWGLIAQYSTTWMWVLTILGVIGIIWGLSVKNSGGMDSSGGMPPQQ